jgi:hypothetical protein
LTSQFSFFTIKRNKEEEWELEGMVARRINEKTIKIVWARAGGICSYPGCYKSLILSPESPGDPHAVLGEMAHIVGRSEDGPRGKGSFRGADRDGPENLLLLCTDHHTLVDKQPERYSSAQLYSMKDEHERWVRERLSPDQRFLQSHASHKRVEDTLHSTLLPVTHIPLTVFTVPCMLTPQEVQERLVYPALSDDPQIYLPFVLHGNRLLTFCDLKSKDGPFRYCVDPRKSVSESSVQWWDDPDYARLYTQLLNRTLNKITGRRNLHLDKVHQRYYFEPLPGPQTHKVSYQSLQGKRVTRRVAWQPETKSTGAAKGYWEHMAISLQFHRMGQQSWCLSLRPEHRYTIDGSTPLEGKQTGRKATRRAARTYNYDLLGELNFWRHYLSAGAPRIICSFGCQHLVIETTLIPTTVVSPGIPEDSRPFRNQRIQEGLFSYMGYQAVLASELGEGDEWEEEEWASEEDN